MLMSAEGGNTDWKKIKELFHEALRLGASEREAFLNERCAGDLHLRIEVETLLLSLEHAETFLEVPAIVSSMDGAVEWQFKEGDVVSHYQIIEPIGAGGMGQVYLAQDKKLHREVALKILPTEVLHNIDRLRRFKREALAVSALNHPNILTIFEFDEVDGVPLLASEHVKGRTLRETLEDGPLEIELALDIAIQVASALQTAHRAGVIHRDIKPENIMIRSDGYVKVLDFGLAKLTGDLRSKENDRTQTQAFSLPGLIMGTATYMSPEQARSTSIDSRTDIFSLGIVIYEMLTGHPPFDGDTMADIIAAIIQKDPPKTSTQNPAVPPEMDAIVAKCLEKDPGERYQTLDDLLLDLRAVPGPVPSRATRTGPEPQANTTAVLAATTVESGTKTHTAQSKKSYALPLAAGVLLIIGVVSGVYWYLNRDHQIDSIAVLPFTNESGNADVDYLSDGMTESLINSLSTLPNLSVKARNTVFRYKGLEIDEKKVGQDLSVNALLLGWVTQRGDNLTLRLSLVDAATGNHLWGDQYDRKMGDLAVLQREITSDVSKKLRAKLSNADASELTKNYTANSQAYQDYLRGRYFWNKRTSESIAKSIEYFEMAIAKDSEFALAYTGLADAYVVPANLRAPREVMPKAKAAAIRALEIDDTLAEAHTSLGRVLQVYEWNWKEAEKAFERAIALNPRYPVAHQWYGGYFERIGRLDVGIAKRRVALELDPLSTITNFELGQAYYFNREYDKALEQLKKTLELDPEFPPALQWIPLVYLQKGMHDEAIAWVKRAGESPVMRVSGTGGYVLAVAGREREARQELDRLKRLRDQEYISAGAISLIHAGLGEKEEAIAWLEKGYEERAFQMQFLKVEPRWDSLRNDPRFMNVFRRIGFPE